MYCFLIAHEADRVHTEAEAVRPVSCISLVRPLPIRAEEIHSVAHRRPLPNTAAVRRCPRPAAALLPPRGGQIEKLIVPPR